MMMVMMMMMMMLLLSCINTWSLSHGHLQYVSPYSTAMDVADSWAGSMTSEAAVSTPPAISSSTPAKRDYYWLRSFVAGGRIWHTSLRHHFLAQSAIWHKDTCSSLCDCRSPSLQCPLLSFVSLKLMYAQASKWPEATGIISLIKMLIAGLLQKKKKLSLSSRHMLISVTVSLRNHTIIGIFPVIAYKSNQLWNCTLVRQGLLSTVTEV